MRRSILLVTSASIAFGATATSAGAQTFPFVAPTPLNPAPYAESVVPAGVHVAAIEMFGAQGGSLLPEGGGRGARVTARIAVVPGAHLRVVVGGHSSGPSYENNGYNGGGRAAGSGGGGASDVRLDESPSSRLVVAGGGGGDGVGWESSLTTGGLGGASGTDGGDAVPNAQPGSPDGRGGVSGNSGGAGGAGGEEASTGGDAVGGQGGFGSRGPSSGGGGGGGGLVGGGGGGGGGVSISGSPHPYVYVGKGGGGGGGSSLAPGGTIEDGVRVGDGEVTITYIPDAAGAPPAGGSAPGTTGSTPLKPSSTTLRDTIKPKFSFTLGRSAFVPASSGASASIKTFSVGSGVFYTLSEKATVTFTVDRRVGKRWKKVSGSFVRRGDRGRNRFLFRGRIGGRTLKAGSYRLKATAKDGAGNRSTVQQRRFRVIEP